MPGPGQCRRGLQQQRQHGAQRISSNGGFRRVYWRGLLGATVHGGQQRGHVRALAGQQRREQNVVLLQHMPGEEPGYPGLVAIRRGWSLPPANLQRSS